MPRGKQLEIRRWPELGTDSAQTKCPYVQSPVIDIGFMKQLDFVIKAFQGA
jgi:hypothetical protein